MFTFKWLAVPSICAALLFAPASNVLADPSTHVKKANKPAPHKTTAHKKSKKSVAEMSAETAKAADAIKNAKTKGAVSKKKAVTMSTTTPPAKTKGKSTGKKNGKHKTHKHA